MIFLCYFLIINCAGFWIIYGCRYVQSRDDKQLRSKAGENDVNSCNPEDYTANGQPIVPCGLIAWSLFNDTYRFSNNNKDLVINKKNIAWKSDQKAKFGYDVYPKNFQSGRLIGGARLNESIPVSKHLYIFSPYRFKGFIFSLCNSYFYFG
jgi:hypothetical protein